MKERERKWRRKKKKRRVRARTVYHAFYGDEFASGAIMLRNSPIIHRIQVLLIRRRSLNRIIRWHRTLKHPAPAGQRGRLGAY